MSLHIEAQLLKCGAKTGNELYVPKEKTVDALAAILKGGGCVLGLEEFVLAVNKTQPTQEIFDASSLLDSSHDWDQARNGCDLKAKAWLGKLAKTNGKSFSVEWLTEDEWGHLIREGGPDREP